VTLGTTPIAVSPIQSGVEPTGIATLSSVILTVGADSLLGKDTL
jgi:hypothetical protein